MQGDGDEKGLYKYLRLLSSTDDYIGVIYHRR